MRESAYECQCCGFLSCTMTNLDCKYPILPKLLILPILCILSFLHYKAEMWAVHSSYTDPEVAAILTASAVFSHPAVGGVQVEKSGVIGFGLTVREAMEDWGRKFSKMITLPKVAARPEAQLS